MRLFTFFLFLMLLPVLPASAADFLAADSTAALYRCGCPDLDRVIALWTR
ncbi:MAG: hypothetical protein ACLFST_06240 [Spirochaetia bacterium]